MNKLIKGLCSKVLCGVLVMALCMSNITFEALAESAKKVSYTGSKQYMSGQYYENLTNVKLTGDARKDIVAVALSQVGYREGNDKDGFSGETKGSKNYTEYGRWNYEVNSGMGGSLNHYWCASFVAWCARCANIPTSVVNNSASAKDITNSCSKTYTVNDVKNGTYTPQSGDLIYYDYSHVGIVVSYNSSTQTLTTVEGNSGSDDGTNNGYFVTKKNNVSLTNSKISFFGSLDGSTSQKATGSSTLNINMTSVPSSIDKGSSFNLVGTVSSNYKITSVKGYIMKGSTTVQSASCVPNSTSLAIKSSVINSNLKFGSLAEGTYTLKIVATDSSNKSYTYTKSFTVKASTLNINMTSVPSSINKGSSFNLVGTVSSNYKITSVKGYIMKGSTTVQSASCVPNSTSLAIKSSVINSNLKFGSLAKGTYTLKIVATDSSNKSYTYTKSFTVK